MPSCDLWDERPRARTNRRREHAVIVTGSPREVTHVLLTGDRHARGIANTVLNLARHLDPKRYRLSVFFLHSTGSIGEALNKLGVRSEVVHWSGRWRDVAGAARLAGLIRARKPAIVHLHSGGLVPRMITRASSNARVVMHYHSLSQESGKTPRRPTLTDLIIANSRATAETVGGAEPLVVYAGVDIAPRVQRRPRTERITLGTAARLVPVKGIGALLSVMKVVVSESPHVRLEIAGDGPERQSLTRHAEELGISRNVRFLGWRENVRDVMRGWDLYVQPSLAEGLGVAVLEAMAEGLPVIASRVGGLGEIVLDGTTGRLVGAEGSLATRINELVADESLRTRMGTAGREHVARNFSSEKEAAAIFNAYDKLLA